MASSVGLKEKIAALMEENNSLRKQIAAQKEKAMRMEAESRISAAEEINGLMVLVQRCTGLENGSLKGYAETLCGKMKDGFVFLSNENEGKLTFVCASSKAAIAKGFKAGEIIKAAAQMCGGKGGGRPDMAQAGGKDASKLDAALAMVRDRLKG